LNTIGIGNTIQWPDGFQLTLEEQENYDEMNLSEEKQWAQECTFLVSNREVKMLFIRAEGLATYCALFKSGKIAPRVFVETSYGMVRWCNSLMDPFTRLFKVCDKQPGRIIYSALEQG
jgi:hypothetical protein